MKLGCGRYFVGESVVLKNWAQYSVRWRVSPMTSAGCAVGCGTGTGKASAGWVAHQSVEGEKQVNVGALFPGEGKQTAGNWLKLYIPVH